MVEPASSGAPTLSADSVTDAIRQLIMNGELGIGVQLKQQALAERFGVSRIPVREALKRLEAEGLVVHRAHQGSTVAGQSVQELIEALDIRIGLETRALKLAIPHMRATDFRIAKKIMARYDGSESPQEWSELNLEFHMTLYKPCGRARLLKMIEEGVRGISRQMRVMQSYKLGRKAPQTEHEMLLQACKAGDVTGAVSILEKHIETTQSVLQN